MNIKDINTAITMFRSKEKELKNKLSDLNKATNNFITTCDLQTKALQEYKKQTDNLKTKTQVISLAMWRNLQEALNDCTKYLINIRKNIEINENKMKEMTLELKEISENIVKLEKELSTTGKIIKFKDII